MSMHKKPLTRLEELGLLAHALDIGTPSQLSDVFRQGVAWALSQTPKPLGEVFDLTTFAKRMDEEMRKHDCFGFEQVVYAIAEEVLCSDQQPAWWQFFQDGEWHMGFKHPANHRANTVEAGYPVRNLYAGPVIGLKVGCTSCEPAGVFDVDGSGPWNCPDCGKVAQVGTGVSVSKEDLLAWRNDWLVEHDPEDGTDCVTPFDKYLYGGQVSQQADGLMIAAEWHRKQQKAFAVQMKLDEAVYTRAKEEGAAEPRVSALLARWETSSCQSSNHGDYAAEFERMAKAVRAHPKTEWSKSKPTEPGAYYVRGFRLFEPDSRPALVEVEIDDGKLCCNLHESNSKDDFRQWDLLQSLSEGFEWLGPLKALAATNSSG